MTNSRRRSESSRGRKISKEFVLSLVLTATACIGLLHLFYGDWRASPGGGPWAVPAIAYVAILLAALVIFFSEIRICEAAKIRDRSPEVPVAGAALWAIGFFYAVQYLGLAVGSFTAVFIAMVILSQRQPSMLPKIAFIAAMTSLFLWLIFSFLAPIILHRPLFF